MYFTAEDERMYTKYEKEEKADKEQEMRIYRKDGAGLICGNRQIRLCTKIQASICVMAELAIVGRKLGKK